MDFVVVILSWIFQFLTNSNVSVIRSVRLLRALRTISSVPSMSGLVKTLIQLIPAMGNMLVLFGFTVLIFATIGMQLFGGSLSKRCILESTRNDLAFKSETR